eukprot:scaffold31903_cov104-Isochrysis_galbana.AAC.3
MVSCSAAVALASLKLRRAREARVGLAAAAPGLTGELAAPPSSRASSSSCTSLWCSRSSLASVCLSIVSACSAALLASRHWLPSRARTSSRLSAGDGSSHSARRLAGASLRARSTWVACESTCNQPFGWPHSAGPSAARLGPHRPAATPCVASRPRCAPGPLCRRCGPTAAARSPATPSPFEPCAPPPATA